MADPLISVVVPTYGRPEYLAEALESIKAQSYTRWEVIVVDDCSPEPVSVPEWVTLVRHRRNMGGAAARNTGMAHVSGELVTFLDDDDWFHPDRFAWAVDGIGDARSHSCLTGLSENGKVVSVRRRYDGDIRATFHHGQPPVIGQVVHRTEDVVQFDTTLRGSEDHEWWLRMGHCAVFSHTEQVGHFYRQHQNERHGYNRPLSLQSRRQVYVRHSAGLDKASRSFLATRVALAQSRCGRRLPAALWAARAFALRPSRAAAALTGRSLLR